MKSELYGNLQQERIAPAAPAAPATSIRPKRRPTWSAYNRKGFPVTRNVLHRQVDYLPIVYAITKCCHFE